MSRWPPAVFGRMPSIRAEEIVNAYSDPDCCTASQYRVLKIVWLTRPYPPQNTNALLSRVKVTFPNRQSKPPVKTPTVGVDCVSVDQGSVLTPLVPRRRAISSRASAKLASFEP